MSEAVTALAASVGTDWATYTREGPGMSAFALENGVLYHTYSAYARGLDVLWATYQWLDRAPQGVTRPDPGSAATTSTTTSPNRKARPTNVALEHPAERDGEPASKF